MDRTFYTVANETGIPLVCVLEDDLGPVNLTDWSVTFTMINRETGEVKVNAQSCTIDPDQVLNTGKVTYAWGATDLDTVGEYQGKFISLDTADRQVTFPRGPMLIISVRE